MPAGGRVSGLRLAVRRGAADAWRRRAQPPADLSRHPGRLPAPAVSFSSSEHHGQHGPRSCPMLVMDICSTSNAAACSMRTSAHPVFAQPAGVKVPLVRCAYGTECCLGHACRSLIVSGNRGLRRPRLRSQTLETLGLSSCCNLEWLHLSCAQLRRLQAWLCTACHKGY